MDTEVTENHEEHGEKILIKGCHSCMLPAGIQFFPAGHGCPINKISGMTKHKTQKYSVSFVLLCVLRVLLF